MIFHLHQCSAARKRPFAVLSSAYEFAGLLFPACFARCLKLKLFYKGSPPASGFQKPIKGTSNPVSLFLLRMHRGNKRGGDTAGHYQTLGALAAAGTQRSRSPPLTVIACFAVFSRRAADTRSEPPCAHRPLSRFEHATAGPRRLRHQRDHALRVLLGHRPQPMRLSASTNATPRSIEIAFCGQTATQSP